MTQFLKGFLYKNWFSGRYSAPGPSLHMDFFSWSESRSNILSKKPKKTLCKWWPGEKWGLKLDEIWWKLWFRGMVSSQRKIKKCYFIVILIEVPPYFGKRSKRLLPVHLLQLIYPSKLLFYHLGHFLAKKSYILGPNISGTGRNFQKKF